MESKEEIVDKLLCIACLCVGRSLHKVQDERIQQFYLNTLNEIPLCNMPGVCPSVCWECAAMLRKVVTFREQMKDSYRILMTYTSENLHECLLTDVTRPPRLRVHHTNPVAIAPVDKENNSEEKERSLEDVQHVYVKEELKNEGDDRLDYNSVNSDDDTLSDFYEIESEIQKIINSTDVKKKSKKNGERKIKKTKKLTKKFNTKNKTFTSKLSRHHNKKSVDRKNKIETVEVSCDDKLDTEDVLNDLKEESRMGWNHSDYNSADSEEDRLTDCSINKRTDTQTNANKLKKKSKTETKERRARKIVKRLNIDNKLTQKRSKTDSDQKILTIELSYEEMLQEREKECKRESYIRSEFKCESCLIGFNYSKSYKAHVSAKHSQSLGSYSCPICKTIISSVESFTAHYKRHMRRYECSICKKRTMDMKVMQQHYYSTHEISLKEYKCNMCGKISNSIDSHRYHKDTHKARVQCPECDKTFSHRAGLMNHRLSVHEYHNDFPCTVCDKVFRWKASLKRHLEKHDVKGKAVGTAAFCSPCGVSFSSVCSYQRHMKNSLKHVTQDQLKFICDHCNRRFADKTKLRDHIEEKHLHKTYQCHICLKPSKNRVGLDQHIRNVHKGRPNNKMCHHCGKGFPTKVQLESHIRTHTGERPFICEFCPTTFSQQSNLYKHNRQVHLNIKSKRYPCKKCKDDDPTVPPIDTYARPVAVLHYSPETSVLSASFSNYSNALK